MEASLYLVAAERPQWPRVYSLGRPSSRSHMPSLVGDSGQVLGVLSWALTIECAIYRWCCNAVDETFQQWLCVEQSSELFTDIRGEVGIAMFASTRE